MKKFIFILLLVILISIGGFFYPRIKTPLQNSLNNNDQNSKTTPIKDTPSPSLTLSKMPVANETPQQIQQQWVQAVHTHSSLSTITSIEAKILKNPGAYAPWLKELIQQQIVTAPQEAEFTALLLAKIGSTDSINTLIEAYKQAKTNEELQANLLHAFEIIEKPEAAYTLIYTTAKEKDYVLQKVLLTTVARIADAGTLKKVVTDLKQPTSPLEFIGSSLLLKVPPARMAPIVAKEIHTTLPSSLFGTFTIILGEDGSENSIQVLRQQLTTASSQQRQTLLDGFARLHNVTALPLLQKLIMEDPDANVRKNIVYAFANFPKEVALPVLETLSKDPKTPTDTLSTIEFIKKRLSAR